MGLIFWVWEINTHMFLWRRKKEEEEKEGKKKLLSESVKKKWEKKKKGEKKTIESNLIETSQEGGSYQFGYLFIYLINLLFFL